MYRPKRYVRSQITGVEKLEGEPIEHKIERSVSNKEAITDGAPEVFTDRKDGVLSAYNIRTDRWEIATDAMDKIEKSNQAKRDAKANKASETKVIKLDAKDVSEAKSIDGTSGVD